MKRPCLPLPTIQAAITKILSTKCLNIAEPRIFCPPKITRYTVYNYMFFNVLNSISIIYELNYHATLLLEV